MSAKLIQLFLTLWDRSLQASQSVGFSGQGYWSRLPCPPPGDLSNPATELPTLHLQASSLPLVPLDFFTTSTT